MKSNIGELICTTVWNTFFFCSALAWCFLGNTLGNSEGSYGLKCCAIIISVPTSFTCHIISVSASEAVSQDTLWPASWEQTTFQTQAAAHKIHAWEQHVPPWIVFDNTTLWHSLPSSLIQVTSLLHLFWTAWRLLFFLPDWVMGKAMESTAANSVSNIF